MEPLGQDRGGSLDMEVEEVEKAEMEMMEMVEMEMEEMVEMEEMEMEEMAEMEMGEMVERSEMEEEEVEMAKEKEERLEMEEEEVERAKEKEERSEMEEEEVERAKEEEERSEKEVKKRVKEKAERLEPEEEEADMGRARPSTASMWTGGSSQMTESSTSILSIRHSIGYHIMNDFKYMVVLQWDVLCGHADLPWMCCVSWKSNRSQVWWCSTWTQTCWHASAAAASTDGNLSNNCNQLDIVSSSRYKTNSVHIDDIERQCIHS